MLISFSIGYPPKQKQVEKQKKRKIDLGKEKKLMNLSNLFNLIPLFQDFLE